MDLTTLTTGNPTIDKWLHIAAVLVLLASALANIVPADTKLGQVLHWIALNFNKKALASETKKSDMLPVLLGLVLLSGCAALTRAEAASPACDGVSIGDAIKADVAFISTIVSDIAHTNYFGVLDAFGAARGPDFQCELEMAEALLSKPTPAAPTLEANMHLSRALSMNPNAQLGALQRLGAYRSVRPAGR